MTTRHNWILGLAGLGLAMAAPAQAAPNFMDDVIIVAKRDRTAEEVRQDQRDTRRDEQRASRREPVREEPQGYGYGYERRQEQQQRFENDGRPRDRR